MKPILFAKNETDFTTNGLGRIDCISCVVIEERNGMYELEMEVPIDGNHVGEIEMQSLIGAVPCEGGDVQAFSVYKIGKPMNGRFKVYGRHLSYRLTDIPCSPFKVEISPYACAEALSGLKTNALESCPFDFYTDVTTAAGYSQLVPASIRQRLGGIEGSILDQFGGEYEWDNWNVHLHKARGRLANTTGITLRYGKNITDLNQEEEISKTVTGIVPFWIDPDGNELVTLTQEPKVIYSDNADNYPYHMTQVLDLSTNFENKPTESQLRITAQQYVRKTGFGVPKVSIQVSFVDLWKSEEYKDIAPLEEVKLCDEITVVFEKLGVNAIAKVVKTTYDVLKERYTQIEVGSIRTTLAQAITDRDADIDSLYIDSIVRMSQVAQNATAWLTSANGYVVAVKNADGSWKELLFMDTNDPATAKNCLRINNHGLGFWTYARWPAGSALDGPYDNAWTIDGRLIADWIAAGVLRIGGSWYPYDPDTGDYTGPSITLYNTNDDPVVTMNDEGITISEGVIKSADYAEYEPQYDFAESGMIIDLLNSYIRSANFVMDNYGAKFRGEIEAYGGHIGGAVISTDSLYFEGQIPLVYGMSESGVFEITVNDYNFYDANGRFYIYAHTYEDQTPSTVKIDLYINDVFNQTIETITLSSTSNYSQSVVLNPEGVASTDKYTYKLTYTKNQGSAYINIFINDTVNAMMDGSGFHGYYRGNFDGYLKSDSGKIAGIPYSGGEFRGDVSIANENGFGGRSNVIASAGNTTDKPEIRRHYYENNQWKSETVMWESSTGSYQTKINQDILTPSGTAQEGDLKFKGIDGSNSKELYRYEGSTGGGTGQWVKVNLNGLNVILSPTDDITPGVSTLPAGTLYLVYE